MNNKNSCGMPAATPARGHQNIDKKLGPSRGKRQKISRSMGHCKTVESHTLRKDGSQETFGEKSTINYHQKSEIELNCDTNPEQRRQVRGWVSNVSGYEWAVGWECLVHVTATFDLGQPLVTQCASWQGEAMNGDWVGGAQLKHVHDLTADDTTTFVYHGGVGEIERVLSGRTQILPLQLVIGLYG